MNKYCGSIFPNNFIIPVKVELPIINKKYGRESLYCRYEIVSLYFYDYINLNITHVVRFMLI